METPILDRPIPESSAPWPLSAPESYVLLHGPRAKSIEAFKRGLLELVARDALTVYMRYVGPYGPRGIPELWARLRRWMETRGLEVASTVRLGVAYDDAGVTEPAKCSYDACVVVPEAFAADRWVNLMDVPSGRYAVSAFHGTAHQIEGAWHQVFADWLPESGYQPADRPCFEIYRGAPPSGSKAGAFRCDLCLPVRPL
jgi:AraC family transcriptional regulator